PCESEEMQLRQLGKNGPKVSTLALGCNADTPPPLLEKAVQSLRDLASQNYSPAMYTFGGLESAGKPAPSDPAHNSGLIRKSAAAHYGPATYELAVAKW